MTDRPLRPLFPKGYLYDTQIITTLLSADGENDPDILSINGASAALMVSDIPFGGPIGAVRVGRVDGKFVTQPHARSRCTSATWTSSTSATKHDIVMIEGAAQELPEADFKAALEYAQQEVQIVIGLAEGTRGQGRPRRSATLPLYADEAGARRARLRTWFQDRIEGAIYRPSKVERYAATGALKKESGSRDQGRSIPTPPASTSAPRSTSGGNQGVPRRDPRQASSAATTAPPEEIRPALRRSRPAAALARFLALRPRRDAGALPGDPRPQRRGAGP